MRLYLFGQWCYFIRKRCPVSYRYSFEDLLALLYGQARGKVEAVALPRRRVVQGYWSVGVKINSLGAGGMLSRETWRSSFGIVGDRVLLGVGHATALHSERPRDILCGKPTLPARETFGALRCRGGLRPKF